jgi:hypothetical protein
MAIIETTTVTRALDLTVQFLPIPPESDLGFSADVELVSVRIGKVEIPLTKEQELAIREELRD